MCPKSSALRRSHWDRAGAFVFLICLYFLKDMHSEITLYLILIYYSTGKPQMFATGLYNQTTMNPS